MEGHSPSTDKVKPKEIILFVDGSSRGNPGPSAGAYVILSKNGEEIEKRGFTLGEGTNNRAEYLALLTGLKRAKEIGAEEVEVRSDSELMINQLKGIYRVKSRNLLDLYKQVKEICNTFRKVTFLHIPRNENPLADRLARLSSETEKKKNSSSINQKDRANAI